MVIIMLFRAGVVLLMTAAAHANLNIGDESRVKGLWNLTCETTEKAMTTTNTRTTSTCLKMGEDEAATPAPHFGEAFVNVL